MPPRLAAPAVTRLGLVLVALLALLGGCASLEPPVGAAAPVAVPVGWSQADAAGAAASGINAASLAHWWQRFDDAQLDGLVRSALQANASVQGAQAVLQQAQALRDMAAASLWPTLGASASAQRGSAGGHSTGSNFQTGLDGNWGIDVFGARRAAVDAGQAVVAASAASLGDVQVQIAAEVALNYILLRSSQVRSVIAADNLGSQQETLQITLWRQQAGLVTSLEAEQARAAVEQNRAQLAPLQTAIVQTQHALAVLTGQPPAAMPELVNAMPANAAGNAAGKAADKAGASRWTVPQARDILTLDIPAQTLRQRADVRVAEYQVAAALARVGQAQAQRWPSFSIGGSLALGAATVGALGSSGAVLTSLLASVTLPVFDGGALRAQVRVQQAALAQAQQGYRAAVLGALQQVEDALAALRGDRLRLASLRLAADAAGNAALLARQRYSSGLVDFQTVLETQRTQFATLDGVASASADVSSDHVRLFKAFGRRVVDCRRNTEPMNAPNSPAALQVPDAAATVTAPQATDLTALLGEPATAPWYRRRWLWAAVAGVLLLAAGTAWWLASRAAQAAPSYTTVPVTRGDLTLSVTANGTVQPTRSINIGSELSGTVLKVNVDVNDRIKKGQVLVVLDTAKLHDQILRSQAALAAARSKLAQTGATVAEARAALGRLEEVAKLSGGQVPSKAELDSGRATLARAVADNGSALAGIGDAQAALSTDQINLSKASITAPADGVVLTRAVDPGNAVAASLQAVTLFTVADDLARLRLWVYVDEADVGAVKLGQAATFTVSAYPSRSFPARITRVGFGSTITDNVVTYLTYLDVDNADLSLRPGMTATATIVATQRSDVLLVPNAALRYAPTTAAPEAKKGIASGLQIGPPRTESRRKGAADNASTAAARQVWVLPGDGQGHTTKGATPVAVAVVPGISDGHMTEIVGGDLNPGMQVITAQQTAASK